MTKTTTNDIVISPNTDDLLRIISRQEIVDSIDAFFMFGPRKFFIEGKTPGKEFGVHCFDPMSGRHVISVDPSKITKQFSNKGRLGGNQAAPSMKAACLMVLCHELTHANQHYSHTTKSGTYDAKFYGRTASGKAIPFKTYMGRPCEVEARRAVDENMHVIRAMAGLPDLVDRTAREHEDTEIMSVAESFYELETVHVGDIVDELRRSKLNNSINVEKIIVFLEGNGVEVV